jgi:C_GCAxxG_C_C family probable redox protein
MDSEQVAENVLSHFRDGFNCAESVILAMQEAYGLRSELIPKVATPFGAGIGRRGSVCGALTGGVMALGLRYGRMTPDSQARERPYRLALELYNRFKEQFGTVLCIELTGCDLTIEEGRRKHNRAECEKYVSGTVLTLLTLTENEPP